MIIKPGVRVQGLRPEMVLALLVAESVFQRHGWELRFTSCVEGVHTRASLHYTGNAGDVGLPPEPVRAATELKAALGDDYDVVLEVDHIHVEFQPKAPY